MTSLGWLDQLVIAAYLPVILSISWIAARKQRTGTDYFLAGRSMSGTKLAMSIVANQVSAVSLIGAPAFVALRADGGMRWLQYELAVPLAMLLLIALLLPSLRSVSGASIYEFVERRFGRATRRLLASAFLLSRGLALGVILYASAVVVSLAFGISTDTAIVLVGLFSVAYTTLGGIVADIWSDIIQLVVLWSGTLVAVAFLLQYQGGVLLSSVPEDRVQALIIDSAGMDGSGDFAFWPMLLGGLFLYMSYYGCDQSQAQRLLTARSDGAARRALLLNAFLRFPVVLTYCSLGLLLAGLLGVDTVFAASVSQSPPDSLVPHFILAYLPDGLRGLFLAAIFAAAMSSIDSAMNSLAAVTLEDVFGRPPAMQGVWLSRTTSLLWGFFAIGTGMLFARTGSGVIVLINQVGSAIYGPVLAVFILAVVAPRVIGHQAITFWPHRQPGAGVVCPGRVMALVESGWVRCDSRRGACDCPVANQVPPMGLFSVSIGLAYRLLLTNPARSRIRFLRPRVRFRNLLIGANTKPWSREHKQRQFPRNPMKGRVSFWWHDR